LDQHDQNLAQSDIGRHEPPPGEPGRPARLDGASLRMALTSHRPASARHAAAPVVRIVETLHAQPPLEVLMPETHTDVDAAPAPAAEEVLVEESLVEEVSIDGMCGVY
jgi:mycofactocin precursor